MLITCPECGKMVSDKASSCPHCGYPMDGDRNKIRLIDYDPEIMEGKTPEDQLSIEVATEFYGDLLATTDGRVWNGGGQIVGWYRLKKEGNAE